MDEDGKKYEVLTTRDSAGYLTIWSDAGSEREIRKVPGVAYVSSSLSRPNRYEVEIDPRYDSQLVEGHILSFLTGRKAND